MNILYICPRLPYPANQGDKVVIYNQLKYLSKKNKITLLTLIEREEELKGLSGLLPFCVSVETFKKRPNFSILNFLLAVISKDPFTVIRYYSPRMLKRAKGLIESGNFDIAHAAFYYIGQYVINMEIKVPKGTATVLNAHNVEYLVYSKYARLKKPSLSRLFMWLEALRIQGYEPALFKRFDSCVAFSEADKRDIIRLSGADSVSVNPVPVDIKTRPQGKDAEEKGSVVFFGRLNTLPNDDAVRFFYTEIFSLITKEVPGARFIIAGKFPSGYVLNLVNDPNVRLSGAVPDIREFLKKMAVVVVPLRIGGGARIKILDAWAAAKAIVSTSVGAEGLEYKGGEDIIIADSPADFAKAVVGLLKDDALREKIGAAGFKKVCESYNPERVIEGLERIYRETLEQKRIKKD